VGGLALLADRVLTVVQPGTPRGTQAASEVAMKPIFRILAAGLVAASLAAPAFADGRNRRPPPVVAPPPPLAKPQPTPPSPPTPEPTPIKAGPSPIVLPSDFGTGGRRHRHQWRFRRRWPCHRDWRRLCPRAGFGDSRGVRERQRHLVRRRSWRWPRRRQTGWRLRLQITARASLSLFHPATDAPPPAGARRPTRSG
jgi:hypothetical protein